MTDDEWISAEDARTLLGVRAQTLYAYASRGLLRAVADRKDARRSLYRRVEVDELAARKGRSRKLADVASAAIAWGEPVLESAITTVREGRFTYRRVDAVTLSERATLEEAGALLTGFSDRAPVSHERRMVPDLPRAEARLFQALAARAAEGPPAAGAGAAELEGEAALLLDLVADAVAGAPLHGTIHQRLARAWGHGPDGPVADLIRRTLVLLADHELNASTFAARVTASTGASLAAAVLSGLATLTGPRHGGMGAMVRDLATEAATSGVSAVVAARLARGDPLPGFGHPLYPNGDIRAKVILGAIDVPAIFAEIAAAAGDAGQSEQQQKAGHPSRPRCWTEGIDKIVLFEGDGKAVLHAAWPPALWMRPHQASGPSQRGPRILSAGVSNWRPQVQCRFGAPINPLVSLADLAKICGDLCPRRDLSGVDEQDRRFLPMQADSPLG